MRQFNSITIEEYNNKKIAFGDNSKMRFSVVRKVLYTFLHHKKGLTLIELLIAVSIFALIVVGFSNIDTFSRYHVMSSDRRAKLQNDASYVLEHMAKEIGRAIGDINQTAVDTTSGISGDAAIKVWIDSNPNGKRDGSDSQIAYRFTDGGGSVSDRYQIWYYSSCVGPNCNQPGSSSPEVISSKVSSFSSTYSSGNNYAEVQLTACWDPDGSPTACGSLDNPALAMKNRISMPAVSTH